VVFVVSRWVLLVGYVVGTFTVVVPRSQAVPGTLVFSVVPVPVPELVFRCSFVGWASTPLQFGTVCYIRNVTVSYGAVGVPVLLVVFTIEHWLNWV